MLIYREEGKEQIHSERAFVYEPVIKMYERVIGKDKK